MKVFTYDTTLRDGAQSETIFFSQKEKINIIRFLDSLGIDFIEIGNPFYDSYDKEFFDEVKNLGLLHSKIVAFGGTCHAGKRPEDDPVINFLSSFARSSEKHGIFMYPMSSKRPLKKTSE